MRFWVLPAAAWLLCAAVTQAEPKIGSTSGALVSVDRPDGWTVGIRGQMDRRKFKTTEEQLELDINHIVGRMGYAVTPFAAVSLEVGTSRADWNELEGERGLEWAALLEVTALEHVLRQSPVVGRQETLTLGATAAYRRSESNFDEADFEWDEISVTPVLSYTVNRKGEITRHPYEPTAARIRGGLTFASIDGEYGDSDVEENRNFAFVAGADLLSTSGWTCGLDVSFYGSSDRTVSLGILFNF